MKTLAPVLVVALMSAAAVVLAQDHREGASGRRPVAPEVPSAMVNPYRMLERWPHFGGIVSGAAIGIIPDGKGATWLHHRSEPPIIHFDADVMAPC